MSELTKTFNWINIGIYKNQASVVMFACCYTHKDGRKMKNILLFDKEDIDEMKVKAEESMRSRAIVGGAWKLCGTLDKINKQCHEDMHKIMFSPFN